jgi:flagellar hook-associated protein 3 FlgL
MSQFNPIAGRTTTLMSSNQLLASLRRTQSDMLDKQIAISTGLQVTKPSDAPSDTSAIQKLQAKLEARDQHDGNLDFAIGILNNTDQGLGDALNIALNAKSVASSQIGLGSSKEERANQSLVIDAQIQGLLEVANRAVQDISLFGGRQANATRGRVFVETLGGIRYIGASENIEGDVGLDRPLAFNSNGQEAFGALSARVKSINDLDPQATTGTSLRDLNGAQAFGIRLGSIQVTTNATAVTVDLTTADTLGDVVTRINNAINSVNPAAGAITTAGSGLSLTANAGHTIAITDIGTSETAADLGAVISAAGSTVAGGDLDPQLTPLSSLAALGVAVDLVSGLKITQGNQTRIADFSASTTIQDMINVVEQLDLGVKLEINQDATSLNLVSQVSGIELSVGENAGGTTATDLGLRTFGPATQLTDFNLGLGIHSVTGADDFSFNLHDGTSFNVNIDGVNTVAELITTIQTAATGAGLTIGAPGTGGTDFNIGLAPDGNGLWFEDGTAGVSNFRVQQLGLSLAATDLGIYKNVGAGGTLAGDDVTKVEVDGILTHMIKLRDSLVNNDSRGITFAGEGLERDIDNLARIRADVGVRSQRVEQQKDRSAEMKIAEQVFLSELRDADLAEVITRFTQLQQQLQATLQVGSQNLQLSLLNFLR